MTNQETFDFASGSVPAHRHPNGGGWVVEWGIIITIIAITALLVLPRYLGNHELDKVCIEWETEATQEYCVSGWYVPVKTSNVVVKQYYCFHVEKCKRCLTWEPKETITEVVTRPIDACDF